MSYSEPSDLVAAAKLKMLGEYWRVPVFWKEKKLVGSYNSQGYLVWVVELWD